MNSFRTCSRSFIPQFFIFLYLEPVFALLLAKYCYIGELACCLIQYIEELHNHWATFGALVLLVMADGTRLKDVAGRVDTLGAEVMRLQDAFQQRDQAFNTRFDRMETVLQQIPTNVLCTYAEMIGRFTKCLRDLPRDFEPYFLSLFSSISHSSPPPHRPCFCSCDSFVYCIGTILFNELFVICCATTFRQWLFN